MTEFIFTAEQIDYLDNEYTTKNMLALKAAKAQARLSVRALAKKATVTDDVAIIPRDIWDKFIESAWD